MYGIGTDALGLTRADSVVRLLYSWCYFSARPKKKKISFGAFNTAWGPQAPLVVSSSTGSTGSALYRSAIR